MSSDRAEEGKPGSWEWTVCGASVTGSQHISRGLGCDDAFGYGIAGEFLVAAVADGAGSVSGTSAWGSHAACQSVLAAAMSDHFITSFVDAGPDDGHKIMRWLFDRALDAVTLQAEMLSLPVPQLATTLSVVVARPKLAVFGQIGDGIVATQSNGDISTLLIEDKTGYANTTWFIQSKDAFDESFRTATTDELTALALSTDGMTYKITNVHTGEAYEPFFRGSWDNVRSGASASDFAALLRGIEDDQTGDDKTMVLATLGWQDDAFYPSARPVCKMTVSSPRPPTSSFVKKAPEPAAPAAVLPTPQPIVQKGELVDHFDTAAAEAPPQPRRHARAERSPARRRVDAHALPSEAAPRPNAGDAPPAAEKRRRLRPRRTDS